MSRLSFRARLFAVLTLVSAVPLLFVAVAGAVLVQHQPRFNLGANVNPVGITEKRLSQALEPLLPSLDSATRLAFRQHDDAVSQLELNAQSTRRDAKNWPVAVGAVFALGTGFFVVLVIAAGVLLSRQYAAPLANVVESTLRIQRHEPLDPIVRSNLPEVITLQQSLLELQQNLEQARAAELEAARLRAFGEVARRVAHEMKNPLTPIRLAVRQLARRAPSEFREELEVIAAESARLESMAKDFAELGRLPEGIAAPVDLGELLDDLMRNTVPGGMQRTLHGAGEGVTIIGHYDPLRRAFSNLLRNAVEACNGQGNIEASVASAHNRIRVVIRDNGPGIPADKREKIFEPYYTEKASGTGLGLAIVRQTIEQHGGTIAVHDAPGGGAAFELEFPA